eukprot:13864176-Alexandrium_andersonii.AAC.1
MPGPGHDRLATSSQVQAAASAAGPCRGIRLVAARGAGYGLGALVFAGCAAAGPWPVPCRRPRGGAL